MVQTNKKLIGQKFGNLLVIEDSGKRDSSGSILWKCKCDCGNYVERVGYRLKNGKSTHCGCLTAKKIGEKKTKDLIGQKFGMLTVINKTSERSGHSIVWECLCDCGTIKRVRGSHLTSGAIKSCGCLVSTMHDITGEQFGYLTVLQKTERKGNSGQNYYLCRCQCGNLCEVRSTSLRNGETNSCGCLSSKGNAIIKKLLQQMNLSFKPEYSFSDLINKNGNLLRFDFAIFNNENIPICVIEFQGNQHYYTYEHGYYTQELINYIHYSDNLKKEYCDKNNIPLIEIPYWDYNKLDINYLKELIDEYTNTK